MGKVRVNTEVSDLRWAELLAKLGGKGPGGKATTK